MITLNKGSRTIIHLLKEAASTYQSDRYLSRKTDEGWTSFTYAETLQLVNQLAKYLLHQGFSPKSNFAILSEGSPMWVISEYAVLSIQGISVPLSVKLMPEELPYRLNHAQVEAIFTTHNHVQKVIDILGEVENKNMRIIYLDEDIDYLHQLLKNAGLSADVALSFWEGIDANLAHDEVLNTQLTALQDGIQENDVVNISYTSGTTGVPKGIMLTHLNYYANAFDGITMFKLQKNFRTLVILPVDHSFAHTVALYGALFKALDLFFLDTRGGLTNAIKNIPINLKEVKPQFLLTVPALSGNFIHKMKEGVAAKGPIINGLFQKGLEAGNRLLKDGIQKPSLWEKWMYTPVYLLAKKLIFSKLSDVFGGELQFMVGGGALLDIKQQEFYQAIGTPIFQGYGLTEAAPIISANTPYRYQLGTSGSVLPGITCKIMRSEKEEAETGEIGEIVIQGENTMKGYFKNPEASKAVLKDNWLWTGDLAYINEHNFLVVTGRNKALLISEDGEKYSPEGIEEAIVNCSDLITHVMLYNNQSKFTTAVISIDPLKKSYLSKHSEQDAYAIIKQSFMRFYKDDSYRNVFQSKWIPKVFYIAPEPFSEDNKMVNSTLKMVRYQITNCYQSQIDLVYEPGGKNKIDELNILTLRSWKQ